MFMNSAPTPQLVRSLMVDWFVWRAEFVSVVLAEELGFSEKRRMRLIRLAREDRLFGYLIELNRLMFMICCCLVDSSLGLELALAEFGFCEISAEGNASRRVLLSQLEAVFTLFGFMGMVRLRFMTQLLNTLAAEVNETE